MIENLYHCIAFGVCNIGIDVTQSLRWAILFCISLYNMHELSLDFICVYFLTVIIVTDLFVRIIMYLCGNFHVAII